MESAGRNPLDLNNLPEEYGREGKQVFVDGSTIITEASDTSRCRKKKSGGKDDCGKVYECRFCSLKFCKSQALGGHMNRHRQERETETLNRARQLVFGNDNLAPQPPPHLGLRDLGGIGGAQPIPSGSFHQNTGDPSLSFRSVYPTRLFSGSSSTIAPPPPSQPYPYTSPSRLVSYRAPYNDCYVSHVLTGNTNLQPNHTNYSGTGESPASYTCIGAPLGREFQTHDQDGGSIRGVDLSSSGIREDGRNVREGLNWDRSYGGTSTQCFDPPLINRFHDRF